MNNPIAVWDFTWNCQDGWDEKDFSDKDGVIRSVLDPICKKWIFQLERGSEGRLHFQGMLALKKKTRKAQAIKLLEDLQDISLRPCHSLEHLNNYVIKTDHTKVAGPWKDGVTNRAEKYAYDFNIVHPDYVERPFQAQLTAWLRGPISNRHIYWIFDKQGNSGKSTWGIKARHYETDVLYIPWATARDTMNFIFKSPNMRAYVYDLGRTKPADVSPTDLYVPLEQLKNGQIFNQKYETGERWLMPPHVFVLSNAPPQASALSADRWKVYEVVDGQLTPYVFPASVDEHVY